MKGSLADTSLQKNYHYAREILMNVCATAVPLQSVYSTLLAHLSADSGSRVV